jgi:hypothetical protein
MRFLHFDKFSLGKLELEVFLVHFALGFQILVNWNIEVAKAKEINQDSINNGQQTKKKGIFSSFSWEQIRWREKAQEIANLKTIKTRDYQQHLCPKC